jgi:hypothetical protein
MAFTTMQSPAWLVDLQSAGPRLVKIETDALIAADCVTVYACATNAARWHEWHPATRSVEGVPNRPLLEGEDIVEHIRAGGRHFSARWTVVEAESPCLWIVVTDTPLGWARLTYRLTPTWAGQGAAATRFHRILECRSKGWLLRLLDPLLLRLTLVPQSRRALNNLKRLIESER